jgi:5-methylcytosine-specific restriction enzyme A
MPGKVPTYRSRHMPSRSQQRAYYDRRQRDREAKKFYNSAPWLSLRLSKLREDPLCQVCLRTDRYVAASHAHHIVPIRVNPDLALDIDNLESLCHSCHSRHHASESNDKHNSM